MSKKTFVLTAVATALGGVLGTYFVKAIYGPATLDDALVEVANEVNQSLPMMVDSDTRLNATFAGPGNRFTYSYTMVNHAMEDLDVDKFCAVLRPQIITTYKTHEKMRYFRENNVELHYDYKDKNGVFLTEIVVSPEDF